ncbi:MAG: hypothetical protein ACTSU2_09360 [Promethearchaeota archaeon]
MSKTGKPYDPYLYAILIGIALIFDVIIATFLKEPRILGWWRIQFAGSWEMAYYFVTPFGKSIIISAGLFESWDDCSYSSILSVMAISVLIGGALITTGGIFSKKNDEKGKLFQILGSIIAILGLVFWIVVLVNDPNLKNNMAGIGDNLLFGQYGEDWYSWFPTPTFALAGVIAIYGLINSFIKPNEFSI